MMRREGFSADNYTADTVSDLACERRRADISTPGVDYRKENLGDFFWERIKITSQSGELSIGRPRGNYDTLTLGKMNELEEDEIEIAATEIANELSLAVKRLGAKQEKLLVVGLGNAELTPDSIGPRCATLINATMHIKNFDRGIFKSLNCSEIAVCAPGVMSQSGLEAADIILGICERMKPDAVFAIDALASRSPKRLGSTIQISDTGIFPGSGIGNHRTPLNKETLSAPVIAIGVPTVISAGALAGDSIDGMDDMFVSPREIDEIVSACAKIISLGINQAFGIL